MEGPLRYLCISPDVMVAVKLHVRGPLDTTNKGRNRIQQKPSEFRNKFKKGNLGGEWESGKELSKICRQCVP